MSIDAVHIAAPGAIIAYTGTSANVAIPVTSSGAAPKFVRLISTNQAYVRAGNGAGTTAVAGDAMVQPSDGLILQVTGQTHIAAIQVSAGGTLQISPLENQS